MRCIYLIESMEWLRDGGAVWQDVSRRCAWNLPLAWCETCPVPQISAALPSEVEIDAVEAISPACQGCPERGRECAACRADALMEHVLSRRAWRVTVCEPQRVTDERMTRQNAPSEVEW